MAKKRLASSVRAERRNASAKRTSERDIDFSDIPESTPEELQRAVRIGRPSTGNAKHMIALRIAPGLLKKIRTLAAKRNKPYQTYLHELLEDAVDGIAR